MKCDTTAKRKPPSSCRRINDLPNPLGEEAGGPHMGLDQRKAPEFDRCRPEPTCICSKVHVCQCRFAVPEAAPAFYWSAVLNLYGLSSVLTKCMGRLSHLIEVTDKACEPRWS